MHRSVTEEAHNTGWLAPIGIVAVILESRFIGLIYLLALQSVPSIQSTKIVQSYYDTVGQVFGSLYLFVASCSGFSRQLGTLLHRAGWYMRLGGMGAG